jgi:hypothetical protein
MASPFVGGPERQVLGLARQLRDQVRSLFLSSAERGLAKPFLERAAADGFEAVLLGENAPHLFRAAAEVAAHLRRWRADVLCCNGYKPDLIGWPAVLTYYAPFGPLYGPGTAHGYGAPNWSFPAADYYAPPVMTVSTATAAMFPGGPLTGAEGERNRSPAIRAYWLDKPLQPKERSTIFGFTTDYPPVYDETLARGNSKLAIGVGIGFGDPDLRPAALNAEGEVPTPIAFEGAGSGAVGSVSIGYPGWGGTLGGTTGGVGGLGGFGGGGLPGFGTGLGPAGGFPNGGGNGSNNSSPQQQQQQTPTVTPPSSGNQTVNVSTPVAPPQTQVNNQNQSQQQQQQQKQHQGQRQ